MARWITRWKLAVGCTSTLPSGSTIGANSTSMNSASFLTSSSISTLQACNTSSASLSSVSAKSKCSKVANSCERNAASDIARRNVSSSSRDSIMPIPFPVAIAADDHSSAHNQWFFALCFRQFQNYRHRKHQHRADAHSA